MNDVPNGECLPPSAHRFFYFTALGRVNRYNHSPGTKPARCSAHWVRAMARNTVEIPNGFERAFLHAARYAADDRPRAACVPASSPVMAAESSPDPVKGSTNERASPAG